MPRKNQSTVLEKPVVEEEITSVEIDSSTIAEQEAIQVTTLPESDTQFQLEDDIKLKFEIEVDTFNSKLSTALLAVPVKPIHPSLSNVLLTARNGQITLTGFDFNLGVTICCDAQVEIPGTIALPAKLLQSIVSRMPIGKVTLEARAISRGFVVTLSCASSGEYQIRGTVKEDFPNLPELDSKRQSFRVKPLLLAAGLRTVLFAAASDETKPILSGVYLQFDADGIELAATDSYRLAIASIPNPYVDDEDENIPSVSAGGVTTSCKTLTSCGFYSLLSKKDRSAILNTTYLMKTMNLLPSFYTQHLKTQLKRAEYLILFILVVILQQHRRVKLEELASQFSQKILFESRRKKLQRFLSLPHLTIEKIWWPLFTYWLTNNFEPTEILYIAIDRTQWGLVNLIVVSLIYDKRAIPIYFEVLPLLGNTNVDKQVGVLSKVLPLLDNYTRVVLGDREFCSVDLAQWLRSQPRTYFCLRLKRNEYIEIAPDIWWQLQSLGVNPGISIYLEGVKLTKTKGFNQANIAAKWKRNYRGFCAEEAWFILTNLSDLNQALSAYQKRFGIEEMFRDYKSGGYNIESTGVNGERLIALLILITLAYTSSIMSGEKIKNKGVVKYVGRVKEKRRTHRRHSSFYIGIHGYAWVESLTLLAEQTAQLMSLSPHKRPDYQRGRRAEKLIQSTFEL